MRRISIGNLAFTTTEESLRSVFERFGVVTRVELVMDRVTGRSRGFAFVEMAADHEAEWAMTALNGAMLDGRALIVTEAPAPVRPASVNEVPHDGGYS